MENNPEGTPRLAQETTKLQKRGSNVFKSYILKEIDLC